ncbi:LamG-like jellyroll fold domain-containing protein [Pontibacter sp. MBLB2868]|uniref:LamG-like jellyroll fold domain-containing protein n=1 Tax=Pontibacter sp. MBLB2868 TaxID=3451555 RepID=UPI003F74BBD0
MTTIYCSSSYNSIVGKAEERGSSIFNSSINTVTGNVKFFLIALLLFFSSVTLASAQANCPTGLVHYFGMDEATAGNSYKDYVSSTLATCDNCPAPAEGLFGGAQQFDGNDDGLKITSINNFEWGPNSDFTIELWMQVSGSSSTNRVMMGRVGVESRMMWWIGVDAKGYAVFELYDRNRNGIITGGDGVGNNPVKVNDGKWHHIAFVRDGRLRRNKLYVDGFTVGNFEADYTDNFESAAPVTIAHLDLDSKYRFNGKLDEVMVYSRALEENEMRSRYNNGAGNYCGPQQVKPVIVSEPITFGVVGQSYIYDVNATGTPAATYTLVAAPAGMSVNASSGEIDWTPASTGTFDVRVKAANSVGEATQSFKVEVKQSDGEKAGLIHHWNLQETSGNDFKDYYTPYLASAEQATRPAPVHGAVSGGQHFDGKDDGLNVAKSYNFDWKAKDSFSIELWMRTSASTAGNRVLIGRDGKDSEVHWWVGVDGSGQAGFNLLDISWQGIFVGGSGPVINDGKWHQVVAVRDGSSGRTVLYVDGEVRASGSYTYQNGFASRTPVNIGYLYDGGGYHYEGDLDEVKLFGRVLTPEEIRERYQLVFNALTELISFSGKYVEESLLLKWATAVEVDCKNFDVERSADGENFEKVGEVSATGNSNIQVDYEFTDTAPIPEKSYYRLKVNNVNGSFNYSKIIEVEDRKLNASTFIVYPNPATLQNEVSVEITKMEIDEQVMVYISDLSGQVLTKQELTVDSSGNLQFTIPITDNFRSGIYSISVTSSRKTFSRKLVIAK